MALATAHTGVRLCALLGCDIPVPEAALGRRYCCSEHRNAARATRTAPGTSTWGRMTEYRREALERPGGRKAPTAVELSHSIRRRAQRRLLREALALAGGFIAVVVVTNTMLTTTQAPEVDRGTAPSTLEAGQARQWADHAQAALVSIDQQIEVINTVTAEWNNQPAHARDDAPDELRQLHTRRDALTQQQATLGSQLQTYHSLNEVIESVRRTQRMLQGLSPAPTPGSDLFGDDAEKQRLEATRERLARDLATRQRNLETLETGVREAMRTVPTLSPEFVNETNALAAAVRDYINHPERPHQHIPAPAIEVAPPRPEATAPRPSHSAPRQDTTNGAPPNPGKTYRAEPTAQAPAPAPTPAPAPARPPASASATVTVEAGDTLWGLATTHLHDATRWPEIYYLNRDRQQPDGQCMTSPKLIRPGWTLVLPELR